MTIARFFALGLLCCSGAAWSMPVDGYYLTELPFVPRAINNNGQVLGMGEGGAVLYRRGAVTPLPGGTGLDAYDLNDRGEVVGEANNASGERHAFVWRQGSLHDLGTLGGSFSHGAAINNRGWVAGTSSLADGSMRAFLHDGTTMTNLNTPYPDFDLNDEPIFVGESFGQAINEAGTVAGSAMDGSGPFRQAALYENGVMRDLGVAASSGSEAIAVNDRGEVLIAAYCCYTLLFDGTGLRRLGPPESSSAALNNLGQAVVGGFDDPFNLGLRLYEGSSSTAILPRPGGLEVELLNVIDMNDAGVILAQGWIGPDDGSRETGYLLLSPVPEPATYALWAGGLLLLGAHVRRRRETPNSGQEGRRDCLALEEACAV